MKISEHGEYLIKYYESCELTTYRCSAGVLTIGWGHTGPDVKEGMTITQQRADELFRQDIASFERDVTSLVTCDIDQCVFDALVSFAYNVGPDIDSDDIAEGLGDSTLLRKLNAGDNTYLAEFPKWNKAKKVVQKGLTRRRYAEMYLAQGNTGKESVEFGLKAA